MTERDDDPSDTPVVSISRVTPQQLLYPEYGPVQAAVGVGVFYVVVTIATAHLIGTLESVLPGLVPEPFTTAMAALLWFVLGVNVLAEAQRRLAPNPRTFDGPPALEAFLDRGRPSPEKVLFCLVLVVLGGALVWVNWATFPDAFGALLVSVVDLTTLTALDGATALTIVAFFVGAPIRSYGLDRLSIGLLPRACTVTVAEPPIRAPPSESGRCPRRRAGR